MNENTITSTPAKTTPWVEYFKALAERLADNEGLTRTAIEAIKDSRTELPGPDRPAESIATIMQSHLAFRSELFKALMEFVDRRGLK